MLVQLNFIYSCAGMLCRGARTKPLALEHASPSTRLLEKWRQMFEVQEALEAQKQEFARKVRPQKLYNTGKCRGNPTQYTVQHVLR